MKLNSNTGVLLRNHKYHPPDFYLTSNIVSKHFIKSKNVYYKPSTKSFHKSQVTETPFGSNNIMISPIVKHSKQLITSFCSDLPFHNEVEPNANGKFNNDEQERKANLGSIIEEIKATIPNIFNKSLPKEIVSNDVLLRICPTHFAEFNAYLPNIKGHVSYYTTCKTLQFILTSLVLNPKVKVHIQSIRTNRMSSPSSDFKNDYQCVYPETTKVYIRWSTCQEGCFHLSTRDKEDLESNKSESISNEQTDNFHSTSDAKLGSHSWSRFDTSKFLTLDSQNGNQGIPSVKTTFAKLTKGLIGLTKAEKKFERIISGLFIFELNEKNDQIIVHTIEDVNVVERTDFEEVDGKLRVC